MESLRQKIFKFLEKEIKSKRSITNKNPFKFTVKEICDNYPEAHPASLSREFRILKKLGIVNCKLVGRKNKGIYKLMIDEDKFSKQKFVKSIETSQEVVDSMLVGKKNSFIGPLLKEALERKNDRNLSKTSKSQESK